MTSKKEKESSQRELPADLPEGFYVRHPRTREYSWLGEVKQGETPEVFTGMEPVKEAAHKTKEDAQLTVNRLRQYGDPNAPYEVVSLADIQNEATATTTSTTSTTTTTQTTAPSHSSKK